MPWTGNRGGGGGIAAIKSIQNIMHQPSFGQDEFDVTVSEVDMNNSIVIINGMVSNNSSGDDWEDYAYQVYLTTNTNLHFKRHADGNSVNYHFSITIIEFESVKNKYVYNITPSSNGLKSYNITALGDKDNCMIAFSWLSSAGVEELVHIPAVWLNSNSQLGYKTNSFGTSIQLRVTILEFD